MKYKFLMLILTVTLLGMMASTAVGQSGACCYFDGASTACQITDDEDYCTWTLFGSFYAGATCDDIDPENGIADICEYVSDEGACCYYDGSDMACTITDDEDYCTWTLFGSFHAGATCDDMYPENGIADVCESVSEEGACCYYEGSDLLCMITDDEPYCQDTLGGEFTTGATCDDIDPENGIADVCDPAANNGACCYIDEYDEMQCEVTDDIMHCTWTLGGEFYLGATCDDIDPENGIADICESGTDDGACCYYEDDILSCTFTDEQSCGYLAGEFHAGATCADVDENGVADVCEEQSGYEYLPGDANMAAETWPAQTIGGDVTYLVNYFRGISDACLLDGFYASADATGDCMVVGGDVTYLVNYFRGLVDMNYCVDYEPAWPTSSDVPADAPDGWPNCD